ncbi:MAG: orotidine-5'-phosphate decarboxylase [Phycisphaerales bacterium]|nr:orotidine-5'-phosphate decarboxylase [Phycisphaerales bacterium]
MSQHFADRLSAAIAKKGTAACVGLDPVYGNLPASLRAEFAQHDAVGAFRVFGHRVLAAVADLVPVVKINIAFFEPYRGPGVELYFELVARARELGVIVIGDVKRGDIGHTSMAYARAQLADSDAGPGPDAVTLSGYLGSDGISPFMEVCRAQGKGIFVLVHTSNASADELQHVELSSGSNVAARMAELVNDWSHADGMMGKCGMSAVGAVVAPGDVSRARELRGLLPDSVFLVPGFGAQGRGIEQVAACFRADGGGALVNSSRGVIFAYEKTEYAQQAADDWDVAVRHACEDLVGSLAQVGSAK